MPLSIQNCDNSIYSKTLRCRENSEQKPIRLRDNDNPGAIAGERGYALQGSAQDQKVWGAALHYLGLGWGIFPVAGANCRLKGSCRTLSGKLPTHLRYFIRPITDCEKVARSMFTGCGVGIATGRKSGLLVLDIDGAVGRESARKLELPPTLTVQTRHGVHLYSAHPDRWRKVPSSPGGLAPGIDVKGDDGFVAAPPTVHPEGGHYRWVEPRAPIAALPQEILMKIDRLQHRPRWKQYRRYLFKKYLRHPFNALTGR